MPKATLLELHAQGLGVIGDVRAEFGEGFNVLTGETGAGKTLLLGALELCLGRESSGSRYALTTDTRASALFHHDGREVLLVRESSANGRLRSSIDGLSGSSEMLRLRSEPLIVIHGQHDSLRLKSKLEILRLIDEAGGVDTSALEQARRRRVGLLQEREQLGGDQATRSREIDFLQFQIDEIDNANIVGTTELEETVEELARLANLRDSQTALIEVLDALDGDHDGAVLSALASLLQRLPAGSAIDEQRAALRLALEQARDATRELNALADPDAFDPQRISDLEERVGVLQHLSRKYGGSLAMVLETRDLALTSLERLSTAESLLQAIEQQLTELDASIDQLSRVAKRDREFAAVRLTEAVRDQLPRVALPNATLRFEVSGDDGGDAQLLFAPNPGLPEGPLQSLASGGELSRVLLALSLVTANEDAVAVFDEVDAGVGGQVAQQIGDCLAELGRTQQVLAITHLASVAAKANHHFVIAKEVRDGVAQTSIRQVAGDERVAEIARMLAGDDRTPESLALAKRLLSTPE